MKKEIIAIDGPSASGKSSVAKEVAKRLNYLYIDSGSMYRCVAYYLLKNKLDISQLKDHLDQIDISFDLDNNVFLNGENVSEEIRSGAVTKLVATIATLDYVRSYLVLKQQEYGQNKGIVMDGRDIGSVVFKDAKVKIYQVASVEARASRRHLENQLHNRESDLEEIKKQIEERDYIDMNRTISPLIKVDDAIEIDTSNLSLEENIEQVLEIIKKRVME
ncbi:MAG: (d)CMP kinase [Bacilli bacterium]